MLKRTHMKHSFRLDLKCSCLVKRLVAQPRSSLLWTCSRLVVAQSGDWRGRAPVLDVAGYCTVVKTFIVIRPGRVKIRPGSLPSFPDVQ